MQVNIIARYEINDRSLKQGGYCMTMLYGVLPPAMAWAMHNREDKDNDRRAISRAKPALLCVWVIACSIVLEQLIADLSLLHL